MHNITFLHLSDLHICDNNRIDIENITKAIIDDILKNKSMWEIDEIDFICFSGDLINSGDNSELEYKLAKENFIDKLKEKLKCSDFLLCQGNHENERSKIDDIIYNGLNKKIINNDTIQEYWNNKNIYKYINQIENFNNFVNTVCISTETISPLTYNYIKTIEKYTVGISVFNTAWNSSGSSKTDYGNLLLGSPEISNSLNGIKNCSLKIAMFHHPLKYLKEFDQNECSNLMSQYDIVLTGHIHILDDIQCFSNHTNTLFLSSGRLDSFDENLNGYTIVNINPYTKDVKTIFRKYYPKRKCFDSSLSKNKDGINIYSLAEENTALKLAYKYLNELTPYIKKSISSSLITSMIDSNTGIELIEPNIKYFSQYEKNQLNDSKEDRVSINNILCNNENYSLFGPKDYGKTTTLKYISLQCCNNFQNYNLIPIIINVEKLDFSSRYVIFKGIKKYITNISDNTISLKDDDLKELLLSNYLIIMFDNVDENNPEHKNVINEFISKYDKPKYIITYRENLLCYVNNGIHINNTNNFKSIYLHPINIDSVFNFAQNCFNLNEDCAYKLVDKTSKSMLHLGMLKTPFNAVLLMLIYKQNLNFSIINEANVVERFMELVLEKINVSEIKISSFDFYNKEYFLIKLASYMLNENKFYINKQQYLKLLDDTFSPKGLDYKSAYLDKIFFDKKILNDEFGDISFSHKFMLEYYIAKSFKYNGIPKFLFNNRNYLKYIPELNYYSGLTRDDTQIFDIVEKDFLSIMSLHSCDNAIEKYKFKTDIKLKIPNEKISNKEKRKFAELINDAIPQENFNPIDYTKDDDTPNNEITDIMSLFILYCNLLRNLDYLEMDKKIQAVINCINGCYSVLELLFSIIQKYINVYEKQLVITDHHELKDNEKSKEKINDMLYISIPCSIENLLFETLANEKLLPILDEISLKNNFEDFHQFFFSSYFLDFKTDNSFDYMKTVITKVKNINLLYLFYAKICLVYLTSKDHDEKLKNLFIYISRQFDKMTASNQKMSPSKLKIPSSSFCERTMKDLNKKRQDY